MKALGVLLRKDLAVEFRSRETLSSVLVLAVLIVLVLGFAAPSGVSAQAAGGLLWVALLFPALQIQTRLWASEADQGTLDALLSAPVPPAVLWVAKFIVSVALTGILALVLTPLFLGIIGEAVRGPFAVFLGGMALGVVGLGAVGATLSLLTARMRLREALMPIMALPLCVPLFLGAVVITAGSLSGAPHQVGLWLTLMAVFDAIYVALPLLVADILMEV